MDIHDFKAAILDMDGVITRTAKVHARAWKELFDSFLVERGRKEGVSLEPFRIDRDYRRYVDGKPRYDGVRSFLESRGIDLPHGNETDTGEKETICGLGNRKNEIFHRLLEQGGVEVYEDTIEQVHAWKRDGWKVAVISSSRNCEAVLKAANVRSLFDAKVDGNDIAELGIPGKPAPDTFLHAAKLLGVRPSEAIVVEDAVAGVEAGRRGNFGMVVGVARDRDATELRDVGADRVVHDLRNLDNMHAHSVSRDRSREASHLWDHIDALAEQVRNHKLALFLDYDGTLTPIVRRPEDATLTDDMRTLLRHLSEHSTVAIVSGRDRQDVQQMVQLDHLVYAGSHGFDIAGPDGLSLQQEEAVRALPALDEAEEKLRRHLQSVPPARLERKRFAIAVHYREVTSDEEVQRVERAVDTVVQSYPSLRKRGGKKIFELQPNVPWDKGRAVLWLTEALDLDTSDTVIIYVGDDETDEDAFRALQQHELGFSVRVAGQSTPTDASYYVQDCGAAKQLLEFLLGVSTEKSLARRPL